MAVTTSDVIGFIERLEDDSSKLYYEMAEKYPCQKDIFLKYAEECEKSKILVTRTYQETITDALEACFSFKGLELEEHKIEIYVPKKTSFAEDLKRAIGMEEKAIKFYEEVIECSRGLLATIPNAFKKAAKIRSRRTLELEKLKNTSII